MAEFKNTTAGGGWIHSVSFSADGNRICWVGHDSAINVADTSIGNQVLRLKTEFLPFLCCDWISPNSIVVAGHSCVPLIYSLDASGKLQLSARLDQSQKKESSGISAMRIFQSLDRNLRTENSDTWLESIHQNAITCICLYAGNKSNTKKISTSGLDGQLVIWDLASSLTKSMQGLRI